MREFHLLTVLCRKCCATCSITFPIIVHYVESGHCFNSNRCDLHLHSKLSLFLAVARKITIPPQAWVIILIAERISLLHNILEYIPPTAELPCSWLFWSALLQFTPVTSCIALITYGERDIDSRQNWRCPSVIPRPVSMNPPPVFRLLTRTCSMSRSDETPPAHRRSLCVITYVNLTIESLLDSITLMWLHSCGNFGVHVAVWGWHIGKHVLEKLCSVLFQWALSWGICMMFTMYMYWTSSSYSVFWWGGGRVDRYITSERGDIDIQISHKWNGWWDVDRYLTSERGDIIEVDRYLTNKRGYIIEVDRYITSERGDIDIQISHKWNGWWDVDRYLTSERGDIIEVDIYLTNKRGYIIEVDRYITSERGDIDIQISHKWNGWWDVDRYLTSERGDIIEVDRYLTS